MWKLKKRTVSMSSVLQLIIIFNLIVLRNALHITGTFRTNEFFKLIAKFGFQKTERHSQRDSYGYIYGNITSTEIFPVQITFAVLDKYNFLPFYSNRTIIERDKACQHMFSSINQFAFDSKCHPKNGLDYLRRIPCKFGHLCKDEDTSSNVIPGHQFTYVISDLNQPRFWYISMVACYRDENCTWHYFDANKIRAAGHDKSTIAANKSFNRRLTDNLDYEIKYDIHLVNGNPNQSTSNPFTFHFSVDQQNILEMNLIFLMVYLILVPMQIYAVRIQKHPVTKFFTISLILEFVSLVFSLSYYIRFTIGGIGSEAVKLTADILDILSRTTFLLILLLLAKGWAVTRQQITKSAWILLMAIWIPYCIFHLVLYVWNRTEVDVISDVDQYQTWPGWLLLGSRSSIMFWFLWELRNTMKYEHSTKKLDFLLHFGASGLVWIIYLPILAIVASQVSPLWRNKLLLGITNSADCLGYCVMTGLLWPNRAGQYLLLASTKYSGMDELDEFNEAPHIRSETNSFRDISGNDMMEPINLDDDDDNDDDNDDDDDDDDQIQIINILDRTRPGGRIETNDSLISDNLLIGDLNGRSGNDTSSIDYLLVLKNSNNTSNNFNANSQNA